MSEDVHHLSGDYYQIAADCSDSLNVVLTDGEKNPNSVKALTNLQEAYDVLETNWQKVNEIVELFFLK